ncbi:hypothetical protein G9A89_017845 [Geosiphon pyriformis]|nr:hypothetical protein G9A89_017845 [Geosiphon pyriformis]
MLIEHQRTSTNNNHPKVAELEIIRANHLGFAKFLYTQQQFPFTYADKDKERLQTPVVTPKKIQSFTRKKTKVESPTNPSYHYTPKSTINISSVDTFTSNATSTFRQFSFQSKQRRAELLGPYVMESKEEESEDQEFIYQNPILENLKPIQQPQQPLQQPIQQQFQPLPPQQQQQMAYTPIAKLEKFTGEEDDTQVWLNNIEKAITANGWDDAKNFNAFKLAFLQYFSNNNSINHLANIFTIIKQGKNEAAIQANYFTVPQILNQFIRGLCSSILQYVCPMHLADLQTAVMNAKDFKTAKLETNYAQAVNLVMNGSSDLDSKLKQFSESINQKLESDTTNVLNPNNAAIILIFSISVSSINLSTDSTYNLLTTTATSNLSDTSNLNPKLSSDDIRKL